jgi:hypothetical protein
LGEKPKKPFRSSFSEQLGFLDNPHEFNQLESLIESSHKLAQHKVLAKIPYGNSHLPLHSLKFGSNKPDAPVLFFVGGVHGLERIGAQVVLSFLDNFIQRIQWDESIQYTLENIAIWFIPIVNPVGFKHHFRCNGNYVDLMRNAPVDALGRVTPLIGGHRISSHLPWFRGKPGQMEIESDSLTRLVINESLHSPLALLLDCHSGFGSTDRLWFPMASTKKPIEHLPDIHSLYQLLTRNYPNNDYLFEPQSHHYLTHGDLWDYSYLEACKSRSNLIPLTLEMGSWRWLKKNPLQLSRLGVFNPMKPHRLQRTLRGHLTLMEFLIRAGRSWNNWLPTGRAREQSRREALNLWYKHHD